MKHFSFIILLLAILSCNTSNENTVVKEIVKIETDTIYVNKGSTTPDTSLIEGVPKVVKQNLSDIKIVLSKLSDPYEFHLYGKIEFFINQKLIYTYENEYLEIQAYQDNVCSSFEILENEIFSTFYIFRSNNRPEPNNFIVFKKVGKSIEKVGETETLTGEIYGDIDLDGIFEIGGFNRHCEPGVKETENPNHPLFCSDFLRVYEITNTIERDTIVEQTILKRKKQRVLTHR